MKVISLIIITSFAFVLTLNSQSDIEKRASIYLEECITFGEMAGVSGAIWKDGKTLWQDGMGFRNLENRLVADENMLHRIASISKPMTAIAILQLWEKGLLDLNDPVSKYIPSFSSKHSAITIDHLLNHSSGIKAYRTNSEAFSTTQYNSLEEAMAVFVDRSLANEPGAAYQYTTYGYVVLGAIIEAASGQDYRSYMKEKIWDVAGMTYTDVEIFGQEYPNKSKLYVKSDGEFKQDRQTNLSVKVPGGGIQSTAGDLLKFGQAVIEHKLIKEETFNIMITDKGIKQRGNPYGMGWFLYGKEGDPNGRIIGHSGSQSGTSTHFMIYLDHNMVVSTLANTSGVWNNVRVLNSKLAQIIIDPEILSTPARNAIPVDIAVLDRHTGTYDAEDGRPIEIYRKGSNLYSYKEGFSVIKLYAASKTAFFARTMQLDIDFSSQDDEVNKMTISETKSVTVHSKISSKKSIARGLFNVMADQNSKKGKKWFKSKLKDPAYDLNSATMNIVAAELINVGEIKEALDVYKLNLKSFPNEKNLINEERMISIGDQLFTQRWNKMAFAYYDFNIKANPNSAKGYYSIGKAYHKAGKKGKAKKCLEKALKLDPNSEDVKTALSELNK